jgi:hypothetical protein
MKIRYVIALVLGLVAGYSFGPNPAAGVTSSGGCEQDICHTSSGNCQVSTIDWKCRETVGGCEDCECTATETCPF